MALFDSLIKPILVYGCQALTPHLNTTIKLVSGCTLKPNYTDLLANGIYENFHLKFLKWCLGVHRKASNIGTWGESGRMPLIIDGIGLVKHTFTFMNKEMFLVLYKTLIRPLPEYCPQVWSPYMKKDINLLENIQRRATKLVPELYNLSYEERLKRLKLFPLKDRRMRGDMITTYKMINGIIKVNREKLVPLHNNISTRSHNQQFNGEIVKNNTRKNFFTQRIVHPWNNLSTNTIRSDTVNIFKGRYDKEVLGHYVNNL